MGWLTSSWQWIAGAVLSLVASVAIVLKVRSAKEHGRAEGLVEGKAIQVKETMVQAELHRKLADAHADAAAKAEEQAAIQRAKRDLATVQTPEALLADIDNFEEK